MMELSGAGYSHSSLLIDIPLNVNQKSADELLKTIMSSKLLPVTTEMQTYLSAENIGWRSPKAIIASLNLANFNPQKWMATSRREYSTESQKANQTPLYEVLLLYMIQYSAGVKADAASAVLFLGDYDEILKPVEVLVSPDFQHRFLEWKAFVPDPYNPNHVNLSEIYPLYDQYVNDKWLVGPDGSGLPSEINLQWLNNSTMKPKLLLGATSRLDYFDQSLNSLRKQYQSCLGLLAACQAGSTATLKTTLPAVNWVYGLYSLFSLFFARVRLVKTRHFTPDDTTVFLIGIDAQPITQEILTVLLNDEVKILAILASNTNRQLDNELNRLINDYVEIHIDGVFRL